MTLDQLVNPARYRAYPELWEAQAPPGERLDEYMKKERDHQPHAGETPETVITEILDYSSNAVASADAAGPFVTKNREEFERLSNDARCIQAMAEIYAAKVKAAEMVLRFDFSQDVSDMASAGKYLARSYAWYQKLIGLTDSTYQYANSMHTSMRKIPLSGAVNGQGTNYLWAQLLPFYRKELEDFNARVAALQSTNTAAAPVVQEIKPWPPAPFKVISTNAEMYEVKASARPFTDRKYTIEKLAPELNGLQGIRFSHEAAKNGRYEPVEIELNGPAQVLVGYFNDTRDLWLQVPKLEFAAQADERGGVDTVLENAAVITECPGVNVHAFRYEAGRQKLEFIGKGSFVILGVVPQSAKLEKRDAGLGTK
jgi:hypothetical protein